ncbi:MAG: hydrogenase maturation nickel metallochaperone HypA [Bacillus sp. (in: Bacteria)]|nr:hydrogenase maturation nickel metallochaperone HypA [Bacillus sp. (in: firmicutes)]
MHELALMEDILKIVDQDVKKRELNEVTEIELLVGDVSNVMPDALEMAFKMLKSSNSFSSLHPNAELIIQREEAEAVCILCEKTYVPTMKIALCPNCNVPSGKVTKGEAFQILSYEGG